MIVEAGLGMNGGDKWRVRRVIVGLIACLALGGTGLGGARAAEIPARRPNVLFIAVDDLNDWVSALGGHPQCKTPNIDRLLARGVTFTRAYCAAPACNPSRTALMTGLHPTTSGVYLNSQPWRPALPDALTLGQAFRRAGYKVHGGGKIFHGGFNDDDSWDYYLPSGSDAKPGKLPANGIANTGHFDWGPVAAGDEAMNDTRVTAWGVQFLQQSHDRPFFLAVGLYRPHLPWFVPQPYFDRFPLSSIVLPVTKADDLLDLPPAAVRMAKPDGDHRKVLAHDQWAQAVQGYLAAIAYCDGQVGRLLAALEASPHADNTIVVFWSDHGWHLGEKQHWRKFALWEEATRVVLGISVPGVTQAKSESAATVSLLDLYPTLAELCQTAVPAQLDGQSLVPLLREPVAPWDRPVLTTEGRGNHAVRSARYRYIRYANGDEELYDHDQDPYEWSNLAGRPEVAAIIADQRTHLPKAEAANAATGDAGDKKKAKPGRRGAPARPSAEP